jgi:hypothetical protein
MVTCVQCGGGPFRIQEMIELPNGMVCEGCYSLLERFAEEDMEADEWL